MIFQIILRIFIDLLGKRKVYLVLRSSTVASVEVRHRKLVIPGTYLVYIFQRSC